MLFRRKKTERNNIVKDKVAGKIVSAILKIQTVFANFMNSKTRNISTQRMKVFLIAFCLISGGYSVYLAVSAFSKKNKATVKIDRIATPKYIDKGGEESFPAVQITEYDYRKMQAFKKYIDSLRLTTTGRRTYDSIMAFRPGLMDSITFLEEIYLSQNKK